MLPTPSWLRFGKSRQQQQRDREQASGNKQLGEVRSGGAGGEEEEELEPDREETASRRATTTQKYGSSWGPQSSSRTQRAHGRHLPNVRRAIANLVHRALSPITSSASASASAKATTTTPTASLLLSANTGRCSKRVPDQEGDEDEEEEEELEQCQLEYQRQLDQQQQHLLLQTKAQTSETRPFVPIHHHLPPSSQTASTRNAHSHRHRDGRSEPEESSIKSSEAREVVGPESTESTSEHSSGYTFQVSNCASSSFSCV